MDLKKILFKDKEPTRETSPSSSSTISIQRPGSVNINPPKSLKEKLESMIDENDPNDIFVLIDSVNALGNDVSDPISVYTKVRRSDKNKLKASGQKYLLTISSGLDEILNSIKRDNVIVEQKQLSLQQITDSISKLQKDRDVLERELKELATQQREREQSAKADANDLASVINNIINKL